MILLNGFIDFLFFCDILINFRTTYICVKTGEEVTTVSKLCTSI